MGLAVSASRSLRPAWAGHAAPLCNPMSQGYVMRYLWGRRRGNPFCDVFKNVLFLHVFGIKREHRFLTSRAAHCSMNCVQKRDEQNGALPLIPAPSPHFAHRPAVPACWATIASLKNPPATSPISSFLYAVLPFDMQFQWASKTDVPFLAGFGR